MTQATRAGPKISSECDADNPLVRKLIAFSELTEDDCRFLNELASPVRKVPSHMDLIEEGANPSTVHLVLKGFVCRYKILPDGRRQIMAYLVPGDICDLHVFMLNEMDHGLATLSPCQVVDIQRKKILSLLERPAVAQALWIAALVDEATLREWLVNIGQRPALQRIAHLLCELHFRLRAVGMVDGNSFELPLTQIDLADTMGLSSVHVNRVLRSLRTAGLITFSRQQLVIHDIEKLIAFTGFNANYLHLEQQRAGGSE